jgi:hypothetical protein
MAWLGYLGRGVLVVVFIDFSCFKVEVESFIFWQVYFSRSQVIHGWRLPSFLATMIISSFDTGQVGLVLVMGVYLL